MCSDFVGMAPLRQNRRTNRDGHLQGTLLRGSIPAEPQRGLFCELECSFFHHNALLRVGKITSAIHQCHPKRKKVRPGHL